MRNSDWVNKDVERKDYRVFKGYSVKMRKQNESVDQRYVVPWEMPHEECKKLIH